MNEKEMMQYLLSYLQEKEEEVYMGEGLSAKKDGSYGLGLLTGIHLAEKKVENLMDQSETADGIRGDKKDAPEFELDDFVKVRPDLYAGYIYGGREVSKWMAEFAGTVRKIIWKDGNNYRLDSDAADAIWTGEMLEPAAPCPEREGMWIPEGKAWPEENENVLVTYRVSNSCGKEISYIDIDSIASGHVWGKHPGQVVAWMPLPKAYRKGEK